MKRLTTWWIQLTACIVLFTVSAQAQEKKVDPNGTWTWSTPSRREGGQARESTLKLKMDGDKLTGAMVGRNGETKITNAKLAGDEITFDITREFNGNSRTTKYKGKIKDDTITGKIASERNGEKFERDWTAKRKKEEKKEEAK